MNASTKTSRNKESRGFTLVEMLVVIGMIAALAGVSFPVYKSIQRKVEKQKLEMDLGSIDRAVDNFETEYNYLPYIGAAYPADGNQLLKSENGDATALMTVLVGRASTPANFKQIQFLDGLSEADERGGEYYSGMRIQTGGTASYHTAWGTELMRIRFDYDMNGSIIHGYGIGEQPTDKKMIYHEQGPDGEWRGGDDFTNYYNLLVEYGQL
jgi:prepilin-type N-terminal cleavage/methylation domain-containing protein